MLLGQYDFENPLQQALRAILGDVSRLPEVRSTAGAITVLTLVLYPYVYVLGRTAFLDQSRETLEAARTLGLSHRRAVLRVALPLARPALAAGAALAVMEALADFGAVNLLNYRAMTDAIYRVWYGAFDQAAALQLATVLVGLTVSLLALERLLRGRARYHGALVRGEAVTPRRLHGAGGSAGHGGPVPRGGARRRPSAGPAPGVVRGSLDDGAAPRELAHDALNSLLLATVAAIVAVAAAVLVAAARRARPACHRCRRRRIARLRRPRHGGGRRGLCAAGLGRPPARRTRLGDGPGLILAYVVRFHALALSAVRSRLARIDLSLDEAARALGADRGRVLAEVQLLLLYPGLVTATLLVFVEVLKELPATAPLRPLGGDTLAIAVWEATKDSRFDAAALPALLIVLVGLVPVVAPCAPPGADSTRASLLREREQPPQPGHVEGPHDRRRRREQPQRATRPGRRLRGTGMNSRPDEVDERHLAQVDDEVVTGRALGRQQPPELGGVGQVELAAHADARRPAEAAQDDEALRRRAARLGAAVLRAQHARRASR